MMMEEVNRGIMGMESSMPFPLRMQRSTSLPAHTPSSRTHILQRIMRDQQVFLSQMTAPSDDFASQDLSWYWDSSDKRTQNLQYMYRAIINYCVSRAGIDDNRIVSALVHLCESPLKDPQYAGQKFGLPNWFTSALLLWMTLWQGQQQTNSNSNRDIFSPFVLNQCRPQIVTFLKIIELQLLAEEFLYIPVEAKAPRLWISRSGLPALPIHCVVAMVKHVKKIFASDVEISQMAIKTEKTIANVTRQPSPSAEMMMLGANSD